MSLRANRGAFEAIQFSPRVLVDVSKTDTSTTVLGRSLPFPVMLAPVALHALSHPEGELAVARAAATAKTVMIVSTMASYNIEEVAEASKGAKWFQLYCYRERGVSERLVKRAEAAGYEALCLTVDLPRLGRRERDFRHNLQVPDDVVPRNFLREVNLEATPLGTHGSRIAAYAASLMDSTLSWDTIAWLKSITSMPVVVKGILAATDRA